MGLIGCTNCGELRPELVLSPRANYAEALHGDNKIDRRRSARPPVGRDGPSA
jgi:hypothetical protein